MFDREHYRILEDEAGDTGSSVGELVRNAVKQVYVEPKMRELSARQKGFERLLRWQKKIGTFKDLNYRALIDYGRKY